MYGYKDIELLFNKKNTIIIAENGAGKTTFINALKSTLKGQVDELRKLKCDSIEIDFKDKKYHINIKELSYSKFLMHGNHSSRFKQILSYLSDSEIEDMLSHVSSKPIQKARQTAWYKKVYHKSPFPRSELDNSLVEIKKSLKNFYPDASLFDSSENPEKTESSIFLDEIRERMKGVEVIYLPTYRRIENSTLRDEFGIEEEERIVFQDGEMIRVKNNESNSNIEFGLFDVENKLKEISSSIERKSSLGYRALSATIIEDLMTDKVTKVNPKHKNNLPTVDDLSRFLGRVVSKDKEGNNKIIEEVTGILKDSEKLNSNSILKYFLSKLNGVIDSTKEMESKIESFVTICNKYLQLSDDSKSLNFDIETLQVIVKDVYTKKPIQLEDLSSGEKQIISLMAHMYLDHTKKKIVLVDEPELSLSIEWQEHVLSDISNSPSVSQLLAITHSPFVFNNELKSEVKSLNVTKSLVEE
nr:AAA family ATPase [Rahnella sp. GSA61A]